MKKQIAKAQNAFLIALGVSLLPASFASAQPLTLDGLSVRVTNFFQADDITGGVPVDASTLAGFTGVTELLDNGEEAVIGPGVEFDAFLSVYDVDITGTTLSFTWVDTTGFFSGQQPADQFDFNQFEILGLPDNVIIESVTFNESESSIPAATDGSDLVPTAFLGGIDPAGVDGPNVFTTSFNQINRVDGFNPVFDIQLAVIPEPSSAALLLLGTLVTGGRRYRAAAYLDA